MSVYQFIVVIVVLSLSLLSSYLYPSPPTCQDTPASAAPLQNPTDQRGMQEPTTHITRDERLLKVLERRENRLRVHQEGSSADSSTINTHNSHLMSSAGGDGQDCDDSAHANLPGPLLALPGRLWYPPKAKPLDDKYEAVTVHVDTSDGTSIPLIIHQDSSIVTGGSLWDAAIVLAKYVERHAQEFVGKNVLELGAGVGLAGLSAYAIGAKYVVMTDIDPVMPLLSLNVQAGEQACRERHAGCAKGQVHSRLHWWGTDVESLGPPFDYVICSDVVWLRELIPPLVQTLRAVTRSGGVVIMSHQARSDQVTQAFFTALGSDFTVSTIPSSHHHEQYKHDLITIYKMTRK